MKKILLLVPAILFYLAGYAISPITGTATVCAGSTSTISDATAGGTWSSSATAIATIGSSSGILAGVAAGTATISYTDGISTATITATVNPTVTPTDSIAANAVMPFCTGSSITFTSYPKNGGTAPTYGWKLNGLPAGFASTYTYIPVDGDIIFCSMGTSELCPTSAIALSNTIVVSTATPITPSFTISAKPGTTIQFGEYDTLTAHVVNDGSVPVYQWAHKGIPVPGATSATYINNNFSYQSDTLSCAVTGCGGSSATNQIVIYSTWVGAVNSVNGANSSINLFPNPATNELTISSSEKINHVVIFDIVGQRAFDNDYNSKEVSLNISGLVPGVYFIKVNGTEVRRFVKE